MPKGKARIQIYGDFHDKIELFKEAAKKRGFRHYNDFILYVATVEAQKIMKEE